MAAKHRRKRLRDDYTVACICPMGVELAPVKAMLDNVHPNLPTPGEQNTYILGDIAGHDLVIAVLPEIGTNAAATVATQLLNDFPAVRFGLLVGIGGGVPDEDADEQDVRLGDVVVSKPTNSFGGVVQYDLGKSTLMGFERTGILNKPPAVLRSAVERLAADHRMQGSQVSSYLLTMWQKYPAMRDQYSHPGAASDILFSQHYPHPGGKTCRDCDKQYTVKRNERLTNEPKFHYGTIGSANMVVKDATLRERLRQETNLLCIEMEAAGLNDSFPCLVIRGICDYSDSHKNKQWQPYAAATAAAYMKELLSVIPHKELVEVTATATSVNLPTDVDVDYERGVNLLNAPDIGSTGFFVGRQGELERMQTYLEPGIPSNERKVLVLGGQGGMGKTQLAIAYAKQYRDAYSSIFWLNAESETTLRNSFHLLEGLTIAAKADTSVKIDEHSHSTMIMNWFSEPENSGWLIIFDNYDDPEQYKLESYYPRASHGSIIVTTRLPDKVGINALVIKSLDSVDDGLEILRTRSLRENVENDVHAQQLAKRLSGLPLALATAGTFLHRDKSSWTFEKYLREYEKRWNTDPRRQLQLHEYQDRTLYTTWDISYQRLQNEDLEAAQMLKLLAYFHHESIRFNHFHQGRHNEMPDWLLRVLESDVEFDSVMRTLVDYCFVDVQVSIEGYSLHTCIHDWTLYGLNRGIELWAYEYAVDCVAAHIRGKYIKSLSHLRFAETVPHAMRLVHDKFGAALGGLDAGQIDDVEGIVYLLQLHARYDLAERLLRRVVSWREDVEGHSDLSTLASTGHVGELCGQQDRLNEAEQIYKRVLLKYEENLGPDHSTTLELIQRIAHLKCKSGDLDKAEQLYKRALAGNEKLFGRNHEKTQATAGYLGNLYLIQGETSKAEAVYKHEPANVVHDEAVFDSNITPGRSLSNLGYLYFRHGKFSEAKQIYENILAERKTLLGSRHVETLDVAWNLGLLCFQLRDFEKGAQMLGQSLTAFEEEIGPSHSRTLEVAYSLGALYFTQGKLVEAETMYDRALAGFERALGARHYQTLDAVDSLSILYTAQGRTAEAQVMDERALAVYESLLDQGVEKPGIPVKYAKALTRRIRATNAERPKLLIRLLEMVEQQKEDSWLCRFLGRAMVTYKDEKNAQMAYWYYVPRMDPQLVEYASTYCDGCSVRVKPDTGLHVCKQCTEIDLCDQCMEEYADNMVTIGTCVGHEFFHVDKTAALATANLSEKQRNAEMNAWIDELITKYAAAEAGFSRRKKSVPTRHNSLWKWAWALVLLLALILWEWKNM